MGVPSGSCSLPVIRHWHRVTPEIISVPSFHLRHVPDRTPQDHDGNGAGWHQSRTWGSASLPSYPMHTLASAQQLPNMQLNSPLPVVLSPGKHFKSQDSRGLAGCPKQHCTHGQATSTFLHHGPFYESHLGGQEAEATANQGTTNWKTPFLADTFICPARKFSVSLTRSRHMSSKPTINFDKALQ